MIYKIKNTTILLFIIVVFNSFSAIASTSKFECKYLNYHLTLEATGFEHIKHVLKINGKTTVSELAKNNWFIEEVECHKKGFKIIASHIQFNDPTKKVFMLTFHNNHDYKIITAI